MQTYPPSTRIGQYEIASRPMMGGMGVVYFALDHGNDDRPVALKTFRPELLPNREARDRFLREGTAWVDLGSHPHIVRCHKVEYIDPIAFLVLELIAKELGMEDASLRSWMGSPMNVEQALLFALQIARGLRHANNKIPGFVHRDLKPENVLVGGDKLPDTNINRLRVTDFGLATMLKDEGGDLKDEEGEKVVGRTHLTRGILGTPLYMAPEQWQGKNVGVYTDVYALGCILYEMLTAQPIVAGQSISELRTAHCKGRLGAMPEKMPHEVKTLLGRCLSLVPVKRYSEWAKVTQELEQVYAGLAGRTAPAATSTVQAAGDERMQEGWSYNAMGVAYKHMGKAEVAKGYFEKSLSIAREIGDRRGEGEALGNFGVACKDLGDVRRAIGYYEQRLEITREIGDRRGEGATMGNFGVACMDLGDVRRAIGYFEQQLEITREIGDRRGESEALGNMGAAYNRLGDMQHAIGYCKQQLEIAREIGDRHGEGGALGNLGIAYAYLGEAQRAIEYYEQALEIHRDIGDRRGEGPAFENLGLAYADLGDVRHAIGYYEQALAIYREIGYRRGEGNTLAHLGVSYADLGEIQNTIVYFEQAIVIQREIGNINGVATVSFNMAVFYSKHGEISRALSLAQEAVQIGLQIGSPNLLEALRLFSQLQRR